MFKRDPVLPAWLVTLPQRFVLGPALMPCLLWKLMRSAYLLHRGMCVALSRLSLTFSHP